MVARPANESSGQRVCLVSGGTGGHLMPALALARAMPEAGFVPVLVTEGREVERELIRRELPGLEAHELQRGGAGPAAFSLWLLRATARARRLLRRSGVRAVLSTGGRASVPVALAAKSLGLPLFLLEQNAVVGRANRWLLRFARRMFTGLPGAAPADARTLFTGTPLRRGFGAVDARDARRSLGLVADAPVVVVTGGSQGARSLNELVPRALHCVRTPLQVVHLSGLGNETAVRQAYAELSRDSVATVRPVAADMDRLFAAADLVVCRGGGTTIAELMAVGRAAVVLPYPHHKDMQQLHNARVLEKVGAAIVREESQVTVEAMAALLQALLVDRERLHAMGDAARSLRRLDAAAAILAEVRAAIGVRSRDAVVPAGGIPAGGVAGRDGVRDIGGRPVSASSRRGGVA